MDAQKDNRFLKLSDMPIEFVRIVFEYLQLLD